MPSTVDDDGGCGFEGPACDGIGVGSGHKAQREGDVVDLVFRGCVCVCLHPVVSWPSGMALHRPSSSSPRGARRHNLFCSFFSVSQRLNFIFALNCLMFVPINSLYFSLSLSLLQAALSFASCSHDCGFMPAYFKEHFSWSL